MSMKNGLSDVKPSTLSGTLLALWYSLCVLSLSSLSIAIMWQIIYVSNPCCALSVSWFTLRTKFGGSVLYIVHCPHHGSPYEPYLAN